MNLNLTFRVRPWNFEDEEQAPAGPGQARTKKGRSAGRRPHDRQPGLLAGSNNRGIAGAAAASEWDSESGPTEYADGAGQLEGPAEARDTCPLWRLWRVAALCVVPCTALAPAHTSGTSDSESSRIGSRRTTAAAPLQSAGRSRPRIRVRATSDGAHGACFSASFASAVTTERGGLISAGFLTVPMCGMTGLRMGAA